MKETTKPFISLCMIVKNEEANLERCLNSVVGVVDEFVIVDTGSTDSTIAIAQNYKAKIYHHQWKDDFSEARNMSLSYASGEWIFVLDGDEMLSPDSKLSLKPILSNCEAEAVVFRVRNFNPPTALSEYSDSPQVRAFRNHPANRYQQRVHNQIMLSSPLHGGKINDHQDELMIWHYGYLERTVQGDNDRLQRSLRMLEKAVNQEPNNLYLNAKLAIIYFHLGDYSLAYTYAYHVLTDLDISKLSVENLRDVLRVVSTISLNRGYYELALQTAQSCYDISINDVDALLASLQLLGMANGASGETYLKQAVLLEHKLLQHEDIEEKKQINQNRIQALEQSEKLFKTAQSFLSQLGNHPQLRLSHQNEIQTQLQKIAELLAYVEKRKNWKPPI